MTTGQDLIDAAATFLGQPYSTAPGRTDPASGHKDCSGLIAAAYQVATGQELGAYVSVTIFDLCVNAGLEIPRDEAFATPGAILLKPEDPYVGWGPAGHIAFSDGQGGTVEATPPRVQRLPLSYNAPWSSRAGLLPGIAYHGDTTIPEEDSMSMQIAVGQTIYGVTLAGVVDGGLVGDVFDGPVGAYGIPQSALDWNAQPGRALKYVYLDPARLAVALTPRTATVPPAPGDCPPGIDTATNDQLLAELDRRLP